MNNSSTLPSSSYSGKGLGQWLLRSTGLEAWFRQAPAVAHAGEEERIVLLLTLAGTKQINRSAHAALLADAFSECAASIEASGGELINYQSGTLMLAWPATGQLPPLAAIYTQLRACVRRLAGWHTLGLGGAAGLGWAAPGAASRYDKASLREVAGILHESQQLGSELLLTAALHQRLAPVLAASCTLHVAFEVPGHRYPATLYQVVAPAGA